RRSCSWDGRLHGCVDLMIPFAPGAGEEALAPGIALGSHDGAETGTQVMGADRLAAGRTGEDRARFLAARLVDQGQGRSFGAGSPAIAPAGERNYHGMEVAALLGQAVFVTRWAFAIGGAGDDAFLHQLGEAPRQQMGRHAGLGLESLEAMLA